MPGAFFNDACVGPAGASLRDETSKQHTARARKAAARSGGYRKAAILWPVAGGVGGMTIHPPNALWVPVSI
ncbi:hypothetical protein TUM12370_35060 [Salmonella enterica subsp. enterica serovar Choleraesuis]|nr:hypothetical protein TUM12370_35060 [Salmonella enterica subsp. enterica serovar Choleraesuis]